MEILSIATSTPQTHTHLHTPHTLPLAIIHTLTCVYTLIYHTHRTPTHVFTHTHTHSHTHIYSHAHTCITHIPQPQHIYSHTVTHFHTHTHICTLIHIYISHMYSTPNTCIHTHSHTHTHILHPHPMNHTLIYPDLTSWSLSMLPQGTLGFCSQGEKEESEGKVKLAPPPTSFHPRPQVA